MQGEFPRLRQGKVKRSPETAYARMTGWGAVSEDDSKEGMGGFNNPPVTGWDGHTACGRLAMTKGKKGCRYDEWQTLPTILEVGPVSPGGFENPPLT